MKQRLGALWLPVVLWMALIFMGSHQQGLPSPPSHILDVLIKKTGHILEYTVLGLLLLRAWRGTLRRMQSQDAGAGELDKGQPIAGLLAPASPHTAPLRQPA